MYCSRLTKLKHGAELGLGHRRLLAATFRNAEIGKAFLPGLVSAKWFL